MARGRGRGGPRQPANPAPVSNPGSGRRTDGGAGSKKQPLRVPSGQPYGQRQAMTNLQSSAPMAAAPEVGVPQTPSGPPAAAPLPQEGIFGPSATPDAPIRQHAPGIEPLDAEAVLRVLYSKRPTPWIARLLDGAR